MSWPETITVFVDDRPYEMPPAFQACQLRAVTGHIEYRRIFEVKDGMIGRQFHQVEWITPSVGDRFVLVAICSGPGGGDDRHVRLIQRELDDRAERETEAE